MIEYRIIKKSMYQVTGYVSYKGVTSVYYIQRKTWYGKWVDMEESLSLTESKARELLKLAENGKLSDDGEQLL